MIEQKMRSALPLLAGLVLASGAWGQSVTMTQDNGGMVNVARELFGSPDGREVVFERDLSDFDGASQPYISLTISGPDSAAMLAANNTTRIVFTLNGATFASSASGSDLRYFQGANLESGISVKVVAGGSRGDRSVTFEVETTADITNVDDGTADVLYFFPPNLTVTPVLFNPREQMPALQNWGATVVASIDPREATVASNPFPRGVLGSWDHDEDVNTPARVGAVADGQIVKLDFALGASLGMPPVGGHFANVDLMDRKKFASGVNDGGMEVTLSGGGKTRGLKVGDLSITLVPEANAPRVLRSSAKTVDSGGRLNSALGGTADVAVTGPFKEGDMVLLGADQTSDGSKSFNVASGGPATVSIPIEATAAPMAVVYVPGGTMDLRPGRFNASLALDFNDALAASGGYGASSGEIKYKGIELGAYAHGISRANDVAITSFLRMTCASVTPPATGCNIFISCTGEDGATYFGDLSGDAAIPSGGTGVYSSGDIASALGGGWSEGGGQCDLMSNGSLEVQHMIRTSGNALHNNSFVVGRTQTGSVGQLRGSGAIPAGSATVTSEILMSLGPDASPLYLLSNGHFYGKLQVIRALNALLNPTSGLPPSARFNAPPSPSGGGFQPMTHESDCAELDGLGRVTQVACFHEDASELEGAIQIMSGDIVYARTGHDARAVFRPSTGTTIGSHTTGMIIGQAATSSAPVL